MKKRRLFGWIILLIGAFSLVISVLHDYHVDIGPLSIIYDFFEWFSISAMIDLLITSFHFVINFISRYFWAIFFICVGIALLFGAKRQEQYDYDLSMDDNLEERKIRLRHSLCRNLDDMKLAGVCSGLARKFQLDPTIIRIIVLFLGFTSGGVVLFIYILLAFLLPGVHLG